MTNIVNYCKNPSAEVNVTDDWSFLGDGSRNLDATQYKVGTKSCRLRAGTIATSNRTTTGVSVPNGASVSASGWVRCSADPTGGKSYIFLVEETWTFGESVAATVASNGAWEYLTATYTNTSGGPLTMKLWCDNLFNDSAADVWFDACQLELAPAASAYTDGAQGEGHSWAGAAHNSVSTWTEPASVGFVTVIPYMMV